MKWVLDAVSLKSTGKPSRVAALGLLNLGKDCAVKPGLPLLALAREVAKSVQR